MVRRFNRFFLFLIPSVALLAQPETATLRGTITDTTGAPIPGIQLVLWEATKELSIREVTTTVGGHYAAPFLKPGTYNVRASGPGDQAGGLGGPRKVAVAAG